MQEFIVDIDQGNAQRVLIEQSSQRPVLVDFWAEWCEPCKTLMPLLERLATEYQGQFVLARVNADEQPMIAQQLGVRSLPTVILIKDGQPVDGFVGAQPETRIRELLDKFLPKPWDGMLEQGRQLLAAGDGNGALPLLRQAWLDSGERHDITLAYGEALIECLRLDEAAAVLDGVRLADQDPAWQQLHALLQLKRDAAKSPELEALERQLADDPDNMDLKQQLAIQYTNGGMHREALETLYSILVRDRDHADTRRAYLDIIASLGKGDPLAAEFQRKLFGLLH